MYFVDNNAPNNDNDKLFKVRPIITAIRDECVKLEPEKFQAVDEQGLCSYQITKLTGKESYGSLL